MLRPLRDYLVVEVAERVKSDVLLVIADEKPNTGTVVATGPGKRDKRGALRALDIRVGDRVRFGSGENYLSFREHREGGKLYVMMQEADVCFVQEPDAQ